MRKSLLALSACLLLLAGCSKKEPEGELKTTAPVDNNAPQAKGAPVAPVDPTIVYPGAVKGKKKGP